MAVLIESLESTPSASPLPPRSTSVIQGSQNQVTIVHRLQDSFTKLRGKCIKTWNSFIYHDVDGEQEEVESLYSYFDKRDSDMEEIQLSAMEEVQLRPSKKWAKRLTDYEFLLGKDDQACRRKTCSSVRTKRSRRATVMVPSVTGVTSGPGYSCSRCKMVVHRSCLDGVQRCEGRARRESPIPPSHPPIIRRPSDPYPGYGNLQLMNFPWWVERMTREEAKRQLELLPDETFLIRWSERHQKLVLSLKVKHDDVKHMRILKHEEANSFYLSEARYFRTVEALVNYYRQNSLSECFSDLFSTLSRPLYDTAVVKFPYQGPGANYLSLELDDRVIITSHDGESTGWWKGRIGNRVGYFPKEFVQVENNFNM